MGKPGELVKCNACGGVSMPIQPDGSAYFHVCPTLNARELADAIGRGDVVLTPDQQREIDRAIDADKASPPAKDAPSQQELAYSRLIIRRPGHRDENPIGPTAPGDGTRAIKSEGRGVTKVG